MATREEQKLQAAADKVRGEVEILEAELASVQAQIGELEAETTESLEGAKIKDLLVVAKKRASGAVDLEAARLVEGELSRRLEGAGARLANAEKALLREQSGEAQAQLDALSVEVAERHVKPMIAMLEDLVSRNHQFQKTYAFTPIVRWPLRSLIDRLSHALLIFEAELKDRPLDI